MLNNNNDLTQSEIDNALKRLAILIKDDIPQTSKKPKSKQQKQSYSLSQVSQDDSKSVTLSQPTQLTKLNTQQVNQLVGRMYDRYQHTQEKLEKLRHEQKIQPIQINDTSKKIINKKIETGEYQCLQERAQIIQLEKMEKIKQHQRLKTEEELISIKIPYSEVSDNKSIEKFIQKMNYWEAKKNKSIQTQQQDKIDRELEGVTFQPKINKHSTKIIQNLNQESNILDRFTKTQINKQIKERKLLEQEMKKTPFTPKINQKSLQISSKHSRQQSYIKSYNYYLDKTINNSLNISQPKIQSTHTSVEKSPIRTKTKSSISQIENKNIKNYRSITPDKIKTSNISNYSKYSNKKIEQNTTPLKNNKSFTNVQEVKYNPNLTFLVNLVQNKNQKKYYTTVN